MLNYFFYSKRNIYICATKKTNTMKNELEKLIGQKIKRTFSKSYLKRHKLNKDYFVTFIGTHVSYHSTAKKWLLFDKENNYITYEWAVKKDYITNK